MNAEYYKLLKELIAFKSISGDEIYKQDCKNCVIWLEELFRQNWFTVKTIIKYWLPIIIARFNTNPDADTVLIYGNYDTTYAQKQDWWKEDPYSLYLWKDKIIWKWTAEWKWILLLQMLSVFSLIKENKLKYNVTFLVEGERFIWSIWLKTLLQESLFLQEEWLSANFILSSIWTLINNWPVVNTSFRWWFTTKIELKSSSKKNNNNNFGWMIVNPALEWAKLVSKLYGINNQIAIPYFYYEVEEISANEKTINGRIPFDKDLLIWQIWSDNLKLDDDSDFYSKSYYKPCVEVTWFYSGDSTDTIPDISVITVSTKLVTNQKTSGIQNLFENWIKSNVPAGLEYTTNFYGHADPVKISIQNAYADVAMKSLENIHGSKIIQIASGYIFPAVKLLSEKVSKNIVNIPMINDDCNFHCSMENVDISLIEKWYNFIYEYLGK